MVHLELPTTLTPTLSQGEREEGKLPSPFETVDKCEWKTGNGKPGTENWAMLMQKGRFSIFGFRFPVFHSPSNGRSRRKSTVSLGEG